MKVLTYLEDGHERLGFVNGAGMVDALRALEAHGVAGRTVPPEGTAWSTDADLGGQWIGAADGEETLVPARGYCQPGDVVECELERIGVLRNTVARG